MTDLSDREARIMAFLDGALSDDESAAFETEMDRDPALAAEVERLAGNDALLREAFAAPVDEGVDEALLKRMGLAQPPSASDAPQLAPANDNPPFWNRYKWPLGGAIAASLAIAMTFVLVNPAHDNTQFAQALDTLPSGETVQLADGGELSPVLTFAAEDGRFCREFRVTGTAGEGGGVACRLEGTWEIVGLTRNAPDIAEMDRIELASGASDASLDAVYDALGASDPYGTEREAALIAADWQE